ncbi:MAG: eukaryotic-like serine/threonine-protein kinase [Blastocatellia bacterium]|nr:eukaryotic-like serine/threonine-protein kinase [Blastocatellia bacterium]
MLASDTVLQGRYRIIRQLGQGGMGAVYEAVDERLDTTVALKETLFTDEKLRKQFEREARLLARMHHPALPRVSDHFNESDGQFLVMQYIAGEDLAEMLTQRQGPFPQVEVLRWAEQLCDALDYLHTQDPQIIHRDIKPQNLKLTARGQIVLLDFGLAKGSAGQMSVVTTSASIFGYTPNYAPLEQIQGLGTDPRSDIYALSATLFHLLTNVKPPDALSRASAIVNGLPDPLPLANAVNPQVSAAVAAILSRGMSQKRDDRFATASAMGEALGAISENSLGEAATVLIGGAATSAEAGTQGGTPATLIAGAQTTPMASEAKTLFAADATSVRKSMSASETATLVHPASRTTGARSRKWIGAVLLLVLIVGGAGGFYAYRRQQQSQPAAASAPQNPVQQPVPTQTPRDAQLNSTQSEPVKSVETKIEKKAESTQRASTSKQTVEKAGTSKPEKDEPPLTHDPNRDANQDSRQKPPPFPSPEDPRFDPFRNGRHPPGVDPSKIPQVRTLPNGTRIVIQPDGTRIITGPKGKVQVIPPGDRPRKRDRP